MIIDQALIASVKAKVDETLGPAPSGVNASLIDQGRQKLAVSIASAAQYVRDNAQVDAGIPVTTPVGPGSTNQPGKLS